jgi:hypothetical protein
MVPRIFIGGTGRSGTGILLKSLGCHRDIYALPGEMRFIIDPDGLMHLVSALTNDYSPVQAREALFRFRRLMQYYLTNPRKPPFLGYNFPGWFGNEYYLAHLDKFVSELVDLEYPVPSDNQPNVYEYGKFSRLKRPFFNWLNKHLLDNPFPCRVTFNWPRTQGQVLKYFSNRNELINLAREFVDDLFMFAAEQNGKHTWCEKTPQNIFYIDFLRDLFPDGRFIHIKRDPRGVVYSIVQQSWGPNELEGACVYLIRIYDRWLDHRAKIEKRTANYLEIKLEDLANNTHDELEKITSSCGLNHQFENLPDIDIDKVDYWRRVMSNSDIDYINQRMGFYINQMGYEL